MHEAAEEMGSSLTLFSQEKVQESFPKIDCGDVDYEDKDYNVVDKQPKIFFVWPTRVRTLLATLDALAGTVTNCSGRVEPGYYHPGNAFVFYLRSSANNANTEEEEEGPLREAVFSDRYIRRHGHAAVIQPRRKTNMEMEVEMEVRNFNIYRSRAVLTRRWSPEHLFEELDDIFPEFPMEVSAPVLQGVVVVVHFIWIDSSFEASNFLPEFFVSRWCHSVQRHGRSDRLHPEHLADADSSRVRGALQQI